MSNSPHSRFIPSEEIDAQAVVQWRFGMVDADGLTPLPLDPLGAAPAADAPVVDVTPAEPEPEATDIEALLQQAREQGYAEGLAQGRNQGRAEATQEWQQRMDGYIAGEGRQIAQRMQALVAQADASFQALSQNMASELLQLACDIARQVVRQELACKPEALLPVVREALDMLVTEGRPATVRLNPADWQVLDAPLRAQYGEVPGGASKVQWLADAAIAPGDVRVESGGTVIDGALETRWRRAVAALGLVSSWYGGGHGG